MAITVEYKTALAAPYVFLYNTNRHTCGGAAQYHHEQEQNIASVVIALKDFLDGVEIVAPEYQNALCQQICYAWMVRIGNR